MSVVVQVTQSLNAKNTDGTSMGSASGARLEVGSTVTPIDAYYPANSTDVALALAFDKDTYQAIFLVADKDLTIETNSGGVNEVQTVVLTGSPTGGTFTLTFEGQTTGGIAYNADAAAVATALKALSNVGESDVACTGGPLPGTTVTVTFQGALGNSNRTQMTKDNAGLTGGTAPDVTVGTTTQGVAPGNTITLVAGSPFVWCRSDNYYANPITTTVTGTFVTCTAAARLRGFVVH